MEAPSTCSAADGTCSAADGTCGAADGTCSAADARYSLARSFGLPTLRRACTELSANMPRFALLCMELDCFQRAGRKRGEGCGFGRTGGEEEAKPEVLFLCLVFMLICSRSIVLVSRVIICNDFAGCCGGRTAPVRLPPRPPKARGHPPPGSQKRGTGCTLIFGVGNSRWDRGYRPHGLGRGWEYRGRVCGECRRWKREEIFSPLVAKEEDTNV
jgi:hypothetical protein